MGLALSIAGHFMAISTAGVVGTLADVLPIVGEHAGPGIAGEQDQVNQLLTGSEQLPYPRCAAPGEVVDFRPVGFATPSCEVRIVGLEGCQTGHACSNRLWRPVRQSHFRIYRIELQRMTTLTVLFEADSRQVGAGGIGLMTIGTTQAP